MGKFFFTKEKGDTTPLLAEHLQNTEVKLMGTSNHGYGYPSSGGTYNIPAGTYEVDMLTGEIIVKDNGGSGNFYYGGSGSGDFSYGSGGAGGSGYIIKEWKDGPSTVSLPPPITVREYETWYNTGYKLSYYYKTLDETGVTSLTLRLTIMDDEYDALVGMNHEGWLKLVEPLLLEDEEVTSSGWDINKTYVEITLYDLPTFDEASRRGFALSEDIMEMVRRLNYV
jgi:hypothetical protein